MSKNIKTIKKYGAGNCKDLELSEYTNDNKTYKTTDINIQNIKTYEIETSKINVLGKKVYVKTLNIKTNKNEIIEITLFSDIKGVL